MPAAAAMRAVAFLGLLATAALVPGTTRAQPSATLCVVARSPAEGLGFEDVRSAVAREWSKARLALDLRLISSPAPEACPPGSTGPSALVLLTGPEAVLLGPAGAVAKQDLASAAPVDRAQEFARRVVSLFATEIRRGRPVLVEGVREVPAAPGAAGTDAAMAGYLSVGGRYGYQPSGGRHRFATDLEGGLSFYDERFQAGLRVGFEPRQDATRDPFRIASLAVPVAVEIRGGGRVHPRVLVRGALGIGIEWRQVSASVPDRPDARHLETTVPVVEVELETGIAVTRVLRVSVAGLFRGFLGGEALSWQGRTVYDPPRVSVGLAIRLGAVLGNGRRP